MPRRAAAARLYVVTLLALLLLRGFTATPRADTPVRNMDENLMFSVATAPFVGGPGNTLGWPGGSLRLATLVSLPVVFVAEHRHELTPDAFVRFLGHELRDPWRMVVVLRWWSIVLSSLGFAFLPLILRRFTRSDGVAFALAIIALCGETLWVRSLMATGDAIGWATATVGIWTAIRARESKSEWHRWAASAALLAGLAIGSKITCIYLWPLIFVASIRSPRTFVRTIGLWLVLPLLGYYLLNPYLATDPVRVAKAIVGNLITRPPSEPWLNALRIGVPAGLTIAAIVCLPLALARRRNAWLVVATFWLVTMYVVTIRRTAMIDPHYLTPLAIPAAMLVACGAESLRSVMSSRRPDGAASRVVPVVACVAACGSVGLGAWGTHAASLRADDAYGSGRRAVAYLESIGFKGRLGVQASSHSWFTPRVESDASMSARLAQMERQVANGDTVVPVLRAAGVSEFVGRAWADQFNDYDRLAIAQTRAMAHAGVTEGMTIVPIRSPDPVLAARAGYEWDAAAAIDRLDRGELDAVLLAEPAKDRPPTRDFGGAAAKMPVLLYLRAGGTSTTERASQSAAP